MNMTLSHDGKLLCRSAILERYAISRGTLWRLERDNYLNPAIGKGRLSRFLDADVSHAIDAFARRKGGADGNL